MYYQSADYGVSESLSRGRAHPEPPHRYRSDFERDRDRVIHCSAFRRLEGKTQVFTPGLDDYYRTRLTHSIEVAQIGRTIARALRLNEGLTEAVCLAHDLGHCAFGHIGEKILNELMQDFGGFEHNAQSLRIVDVLEHPYPDFAGLNLMYETRLGLARHHTPYDAPKDTVFSEPNCTLEGQIADMADRIAVSSHDLEDGMRARLIAAEQLKGIRLFEEARQMVGAESISDKVVRSTRTAKAIIETLVSDCIEASLEQISRSGVKSADEVMALGHKLIGLTSENHGKLIDLEQFLLKNFYLHESLRGTEANVRKWLGGLFEAFCRHPELMPGYFRRLAEREGLERTVCDYIAGMTDRFCLQMVETIEGKRLQPDPT